MDGWPAGAQDARRFPEEPEMSPECTVGIGVALEDLFQVAEHGLAVG